MLDKISFHKHFKLPISASTSYLVTGSIKKLFLQLSVKYSWNVFSVFGTLSAIPDPTFLKYSLNLFAISCGLFIISSRLFPVNSLVVDCFF